ncbi:MAG TPA: phosphoribosylformylglycinamidine synthase subunit PurL [Thermoanaerobaculia bacterium]|nr:phosphoribosylformylglycinamidine synthase subunit PurL [Thermoanaerobaculia bacterium]
MTSPTHDASRTVITEELIREHNLSDAEYAKIQEILDREPNLVELGIFSAMWSEHCSYKSSRVHLKTFPTKGPAVLQGPGENAGVIDIGDGLAVAFKMESHNHPSFIEPYQGAATGVGGILRDIFTMGARPIASLNSLRFGDLAAPRMKHLLDGVVRGIAGYGNCIGIPTVGGETTFHPAYNGNILVNVMNVGVLPKDKIFRGRAEGTGNPVVYVGSKTGRDGIHGATMASEEFAGDETQQKRPTVQVGDPFTEKLLMEACLELFQTDAVVGIQDMGAAGLTSSSFEMAGRAGSGVEIDLSKVPVREEGMTPYEIMLSESQERMLLVARKDRLEEVLAIFRKWELDAVQIGRVTSSGRVVLFFEGKIVADLPAAPLSDQAPVYDRPRAAAAPTPPPLWPQEPEPADYGECLRRILASPNVAEKSWIWTQYDHMVGTNTVERPGGDAALVRLKGTSKALALKSDVNPFFCALDPYRGGALAVAEAARSIACTGARPLAITDCLNFGNPEKPEVMSQFEAAVRGIAEACQMLQTPVVSGNVSFYNETDGLAIPPTPTVGMVGLLDDVERRVRMPFRRDGDMVALLGANRDELGGSEFLRTIRGRDEGPCPEVDLPAERRLVALLVDLAGQSLVSSAHDVSDGGLAVAIAECAMKGGLGAEISLVAGGVRASALLFGESAGRAIVSFAPEAGAAVEGAAKKAGVPFARIGRVGGARLKISLDKRPVIDEPVATLTELWKTAFSRAIESADVL